MALDVEKRAARSVGESLSVCEHDGLRTAVDAELGEDPNSTQKTGPAEPAPVVSIAYGQQAGKAG